jgi:hypothetical protein
MSSYKEVCARMERYAEDSSRPSAFRGQVIRWLSEYSETNHARMMTVVDVLKRMQGDRYDLLSPDDKALVYQIGCDIGSGGGFVAQQACFYIAVNFLDPPDKRLVCLKYLWNGAGDWKI